ncbi:MAG TPA: DCC1-like thiol-disulfide oxidoreductase family protein [Vicinamibacterales bacterium]|jgi:predicted DCC family thiol-disulfide oxidoreductase YuxK|nr:DCC1-like thiol-disulfide oxidoreductase family protein [Vicinamibacterales bacterium]
MIRRAIGWWDAFWFTPAPASTLGACRVLFFGSLFLWQWHHDFSAWGRFSSVLWMPVWLFDVTNIPAFPAPVIAVMQSLWKASLLLSAIGLFTRPAMVVAFVLGTYLMGLPHNFGQTQHFDTLVVFASGALALSRAGDACSADALIAAARGRAIDLPRDDGEYRWPIRFVWVAMALIFCAAGLSKLRHSGLEWIFSDNLAWLLRRQQYHISDGEPLTRWGLLVARHSVAARGLALASVSIELFYPLALVSRRARYVLAPAGLAMLLGIRLLMGPTFEQFMMCYVFWIPWASVAAAVRRHAPSGANRLVVFDGSCGLCTGTIAVLRRLDVLGRLRVTDARTDWIRLAAAYPFLNLEACLTDMQVVVTRKNGASSVETGFDAYRSMAWVVPLAWPLLPLLYMPGVPAVGRRVYRFVASHRSADTCGITGLQDCRIAEREGGRA